MEYALRCKNILTGLMEPEPPPPIAKDAQDLEKVLRAIANRFPLTGNLTRKSSRTRTLINQ
ncbi:hypothetical protein QUA71_05475 [Microcoleus sp. MON1_C5]|uniref:hypothetical protein n=1 Tax=Microcoleus sp. MON1_C5 TaxID=2818828 RepID=UPI002FD4CFAE